MIGVVAQSEWDRPIRHAIGSEIATITTGETPMAVATVSTHRITPGKRAEGLKAFAEAKKLSLELGAKDVRIQVQLYGPEGGIVAYVTEHEDLAAVEAHGRKLLKLPAGPIAHAVIAGVMTVGDARVLWADVEV